nr:hypothetical protein Iba_chr13eCG8550 [Ipomoea batatas]
MEGTSLIWHCSTFTLQTHDLHCVGLLAITLLDTYSRSRPDGDSSLFTSSAASCSLQSPLATLSSPPPPHDASRLPGTPPPTAHRPTPAIDARSLIDSSLHCRLPISIAVFPSAHLHCSRTPFS